MQNTKNSDTPSHPETSLIDRIINNQAILGYLFILPSLIGFIAFYAYPAGRALGISFLEWNLLSDPEFVGLANYQEINDKNETPTQCGQQDYHLWIREISLEPTGQDIH